MRLLIIDMQPIDPPVGGGRIRLLGLYHGLGEDIEATYIGTYDWPGEKYRDHMLSHTLREIDVPLSSAHFHENDKLSILSGGMNFIDVLFSRHGFLSEDYVNKVRAMIPRADVVVFSHPWVYPLVYDCLDFSSQYVVYDSQNVEVYLRYAILEDNGGFGTDAVWEVAAAERKICNEAHEIIVCSEEDGRMFSSLFLIPLSKMTVVPNGVFSKKITPQPDRMQRLSAKKKLGFEGPAVFFMGSNYGPNIEAAHYIIDNLSGLSAETLFVIAGGVGYDNALVRKAELHKNVVVTGFIKEEDKLAYLHASDFAVNPMSRGSGTNIKMFDFMASGLPVIATPVGARGIVSGSGHGVFVCSREEFPEKVAELLKYDYDSLILEGLKGRKHVEGSFSWEKISSQLGRCLIKSSMQHKYINQTESNTKPAVAIMSTWNIKCGIAEYSRYLAEGFVKNDYQVLIIANDSIRDLKKDNNEDCYFYGGWEYGTSTLNRVGIDVPGIIRCVKELDVGHFFIQHHDAFFSFEALFELCEKLFESNVKTAIMFHNKSVLNSRTAKEFSKYGVRIFSHHDIPPGYHDLIEWKKIPHGVLNGAEYKYKVRQGEDYIIGSFGFLRPHKGILELIRALPMIHRHNPQVKLLCINSIYHDADSLGYFKKCRDEVTRLKLNDSVSFITEFLPVQEVMDNISRADLVVFPYWNVDDGSSASANMAIACQRPFVISRSPIFNSFRGDFPELESIKPEIIAETVVSLLDKENLSRLSKKSWEYAERNSWVNVARLYLSETE
jgi:glycosyltransferase involved in cell wall biosynthesis